MATGLLDKQFFLGQQNTKAIQIFIEHVHKRGKKMEKERKQETRGRVSKFQREREQLRARANSCGLTEGCVISGCHNVDPWIAFNDKPGSLVMSMGERT